MQRAGFRLRERGGSRVTKAVLVDFGGVLTIEKTGSAAIAKYIAKRCGDFRQNR